MPDDYGLDPVEGELMASSVHEPALRREALEVGEVSSTSRAPASA